MIIFQNPGLPDIRAFTTIGISVKEGENTIGYFGSGFKNAVAIILRHGLKLTLHAGPAAYEFSTKPITVRGEQFNLVTMNGKELGFTTKMARNWELWMAYRELWSNCKDEGGEILSCSKLGIIEEYTAKITQVIVEGAEFDQIHTNRAEFILESSPLFTSKTVDVHSSPSRSIFYQGIKVGDSHAYDFKGRSLFTYNIRDEVTLTEDRTLRYNFDITEHVANAIMCSEDENFIEQTITSGEQYFESEVDLILTHKKPNETFLSVMARLMKRCHSPVNKSAKALWRMHVGNIVAGTEANLSTVEAKQLARAIAFAESIGFPVQEYSVRVFETLGKSVLGKAENGQIKIARQAFSLGGTKMVAATLIEEFIHLYYDLHDCTREFQDFLLCKIVSMGEEINEEPL